MTQDFSEGPFFDDDPDGRPYPLLRHIVSELKPAGTALEFGVAHGTSLKIIAEHMPAVGFDSFLGLPEEWRGYPIGQFASDPPDIPNTRLVDGLFSDTLPDFDFDAIKPIGLVHIDCDLYTSTMTVLNHLERHLRPGCYVVLDDYWHVDSELNRTPDQVSVAWADFAKGSQIDWNVVGYSLGVWAVHITQVEGC